MLEKISRFYLSKKTFLIAVIATMILGPVSAIVAAISGEMLPFDWMNFLIVLCSMIGLLITRQKEDHILMNGIISGILITIIIRYGYYIQYIADGLSDYRSGGFASCFDISLIFLAFFILFLIAYNHFSLNRMGVVNQTKITINQFLLFLAFFSPVTFFLLGVAEDYSVLELILTAVSYSADSSLLLVVACCEFDLAVNRKDGVALEKANSKDILLALWYTLSALFSVLFLSIVILTAKTNPIMISLSSIDLLVSLVVLFYYLNKRKEPSLKGKRRLRVSLILTIGLTVFSLGYFIVSSF